MELRVRVQVADALDVRAHGDTAAQPEGGRGKNLRGQPLLVFVDVADVRIVFHEATAVLVPAGDEPFNQHPLRGTSFKEFHGEALDDRHLLRRTERSVEGLGEARRRLLEPDVQTRHLFSAVLRHGRSVQVLLPDVIVRVAPPQRMEPSLPIRLLRQLFYPKAPPHRSAVKGRPLHFHQGLVDEPLPRPRVEAVPPHALRRQRVELPLRPRITVGLSLRDRSSKQLLRRRTRLLRRLRTHRAARHRLHLRRVAALRLLPGAPAAPLCRRRRTSTTG
mmetsp:Transcript_28338/g.91382  ORF Transcript_28338/g.91382 Transcript_28338/m.91382 type:complete len:276 (-) Transcript_28338:211-1038(-)